MNKKGMENRRVRITEKAMRSALVELLREKPINKISVRELSDLADISRGTFYVHYVDIYDMVDKLEDEFVDHLKRTIAEVGECNFEHLTVILERLFTAFEDESELFTTLLSGSTAYEFTEKIKAAIEPPIRESLGELLNEIGHDDPRIADYFVTFIVSSTLAIVTQWTKDGKPYSIPGLSKILAKVFTDTKFSILEYVSSKPADFSGTGNCVSAPQLKRISVDK